MWGSTLLLLESTGQHTGIFRLINVSQMISVLFLIFANDAKHMFNTIRNGGEQELKFLKHLNLQEIKKH